MIKAGILAVTLCGLASGVSAATNYLCEINDKGTRAGFIFSPYLFIVRDDGTGAQVIDPLILSTQQQGVQARLRQRNSGVSVLSWNVPNIPIRGASRATMRARAVLDTKALTVNIRGSFATANNRENGQGTCQIVTERQLKSGDWFKSR